MKSHIATASASRLALDGGTPVRRDPLPVRRLFGDEERRAVMGLMDRAISEASHLLGYNGPEEEAYCQAIVQQMGGGYADGVNSGTNAVFVALAALGLEPGSEVIVSPVSDPGGIMPVRMIGCVPMAADSEPGLLNTSAVEIQKVLSPRTRAILVAHIGGIPVDMDPILELARQHDLKVVEDCAQIHGAFYQGRPVGSLGDIASFSTMFGKHHASAGQGGLVYTRQESLYWSARRMADRGKPFGLPEARDNVVCGLNCNMDELHAAIGRVNLAKLPEFVAQRRKVVARLVEGCHSLQATEIITERPGDQASYWFIQIRLDWERLGIDKQHFARAMEAEGVPVVPHYDVYPTRMSWIGPGPKPELPNARAAEDRIVRVVIHEGWRESDADDFAKALGKIEAAYCKG